MQKAIDNWNNAPGPQYYSYTGRANDTWIYIAGDHPGHQGLASNTYGMTWNCDTNGYCYNRLDHATWIKWSNVVINEDAAASHSTNILIEGVAHESGHAMGLAHNSTDSRALMYPVDDGTVLAPTAHDIGSSPPCAGWGLRCIYDYP